MLLELTNTNEGKPRNYCYLTVISGFFMEVAILSNPILTKNELEIQYTKLGKSDRQIGQELNVDRTTITHLRHKYGILARTSTGSTGELLLKKELENRQYAVEYLKEESRISQYGFKVNGAIRIQTLTAVYKDKTAYFTFTDKKEVQCIESEIRIRLGNGRTRKLFRKTCDFLVFIALEKGEPHFWILPSNAIPDHVQGISLNPYSERGKYDIYKNAWNLILSASLEDKTA